MDKLASCSIRTVSMCTVFLAKLGLIENRNFCFDHHMILSVGEGALYLCKGLVTDI